MVLRRLLFTLLNSPQLIEKLAESRPVRRAAQITAFAITKAQLSGRDVIQKLLKSNTLQQISQEARVPRDIGELSQRVGRIKDTFVKEVKEGMKEVSERTKGK